jgi:indolepyruvate ferredoxin oxidoreductase beta subunit
MESYNIIIAGVGGQGVVLAGNIIGEVSLNSGCDVKKTDTLGMAQRGGSVVSHLRIAAEVFSPLIRWGEADILLALEKLEAARWVCYLRSGGVAIVNNQALPPLSVSLGSDSYPDDEEIIGILRRQTERLYLVDGVNRAKELGNIKVLNVFMLGCLSHFLPFEDSIWQKCITGSLPSKAVALNINAFEQGKEEIKKMLVKEKGCNDAR